MLMTGPVYLLRGFFIDSILEFKKLPGRCSYRWAIHRIVF